MTTRQTVDADTVVLERGEGESPGLDGDTEVTAAGAARLLGAHPRTIRRHIQRGTLPAELRRVNGTPTHYIRVSDLEEFRAKEGQKAAELADNGRSELGERPHTSSGALIGPKMDPQALVSALLGHLEAQNGRVEALARENGRLEAQNSRLLAENAALEAKIGRLGRSSGASTPHPRAKHSLGALVAAFLSK